ncbi:hypothetical protein ASPZODRAFT_72648 [Penicilliopsis zonata CBS 506.65]|uniref:Ell binding protein Ebp1 C-terminal domain-containing protein n=1 Tax=Penicilliopsis zonata CBS 506.65 TaxID=1073090 RepID=A0A1L9SAQ0_9EURO|nr:hypothetical protein ASPZODRAFT_72648 [Penicilliopsis zonata CBS 506.65]OJJ44197.1 hypothetical protein ASPZODRAFT_72648 [Penicilliopsis zonata CBS 506.65]
MNQTSPSSIAVDTIYPANSIEKRLERLRDEVLPFYPFILTVPTDVPFRLGGRFVNNWAVGKDGPFAPEEQQLQYMTFLTHHEGDSLLLAVGDWSDGTGSIMADHRQSESPDGVNTPKGDTVKKKISLTDYKNKTKPSPSAGPSYRDTSKSSALKPQKHQGQQRTSKAEPLQHEKNNMKSTPNMRPQERPIDDRSGRKRLPDNESDQSELQGLRNSDWDSHKKPRLSVKQTGNKGSNRAKSNANSLPVLLSPTLPPTSVTPKLPRLLSPTLPPDIEEELVRLRNDSPNQDLKRTPSVISNASKDETTKIHPTERNKTHSATLGRNVSSKPTDFAARNTSLRVVPTNSSSRDPSRGEVLLLISKHDSQSTPMAGTPRVDDLPLESKIASLPVTKPQFIVKLKYGRSNRKRVEALLKFSGKKKLALGMNSSAQDIPFKKEDRTLHSTKLGPERVPPPSSRTEKMSRQGNPSTANDSSSEPSRGAKSVIVKSDTPLARGASSTSTQHPQEKIKRPEGTSHKDQRESYARRTRPGDNSEESKNTLQATKANTGGSERAPKLSPSQSDSQSVRAKSNDRRAWRDEYQRLGNLGRELKHTAERQRAKEAGTVTDDKLATVTAIEAILCFTLAFVADDRSKQLARQTGDSSTWLSILAYWRVVKKSSSAYPQLHSLCLLLGAVSYDAIHALDLERLAASSLPGDLAVAPTPGSDGSTVISEETRRARMEFIDLKTRLLDCYKESQRLWIEGTCGLSEDIISHEFPITWSKRSKNYSERGNQHFGVAEYAGDYFLPFGKTTAPIEVVRFCWTLVNEWCRKENVTWNSRLGL